MSALLVVERSGVRLGLDATLVRGVRSADGSSAPELAWPAAPPLPEPLAFEIDLELGDRRLVLGTRQRATLVEVEREAICAVPELLAARVAPTTAVVFSADGGPILVVDPALVASGGVRPAP